MQDLRCAEVGGRRHQGKGADARVGWTARGETVAVFEARAARAAGVMVLGRDEPWGSMAVDGHLFILDLDPLLFLCFFVSPVFFFMLLALGFQAWS